MNIIVEMQKVLLLDFDGVICKHPKSAAEISRRASQYVKKIVNIKNDKDAATLNKHLYKTFGHTVLGLQKLGYNIKPSDFDKYVYSDLDYDNLFNDFKSSNKDDIEAIRKLNIYTKKMDIPLYIFSNAPQVWCNHIMDQMIDDQLFFNYVENMNDLKPSYVLYENISYSFRGLDIVFVDDQFINFSWTLNNKQWKNIHYNPDSDEDYNIGDKKNLLTIRSLDQLNNILIN